MNFSKIIVLISVLMVTSSCEDIASALAGVEPPTEIDNPSAPLDNPIDPSNPNRFVPQIAVTLSPDPSQNGGVISENSISVNISVTNAAQNPDPNGLVTEYAYVLSNAYQSIPDRENDVFSSSSSFSINRLNEGEHVLTIRYKLNRETEIRTVDFQFTVDAFTGTSMLLQQETDWTGSEIHAHVWLENVTDVGIGSVNLEWPAGSMTFSRVTLDGGNMLFSSDALMLADAVSENQLTVNVSAVSGTSGSLSGTGRMCTIIFERNSSFTGERTLSITQQSKLRTARNAEIPLDNVNSIVVEASL